MDWNNFTLKQMKKSKLYENLPKEYNKSTFKKAGELAILLNKAMKDDTIPDEFKTVNYLHSKKSLSDKKIQKKAEKYTFSNPNSRTSSTYSSPTGSPRSLNSSDSNSPKSLNSSIGSQSSKIDSPTIYMNTNNKKKRNKNDQNSIRFLVRNINLSEPTPKPVSKNSDFQYK